MSSIFYKEMGSMFSSLTINSLLCSFFFSVILMLFGRGLFFKLEKSPNSSLVPVYNLFVLNEGLEINPLYTILYFIPFINLIYYIYICYKLGYVFSESYDFRLGLVFMPYVYFKFLSNSKKEADKRKEEENREVMDDALLYTDEQLRNLNSEDEEDTPKVDSIFKSDVEVQAENAPTYKAAQNKIGNLDFDAIDEKHKVVFIPSSRSENEREDIVTNVKTTYMNSNEDKKHEGEIDVYEIK